MIGDDCWRRPERRGTDPARFAACGQATVGEPGGRVLAQAQGTQPVADHTRPPALAQLTGHNETVDAVAIADAVTHHQAGSDGAPGTVALIGEWDAATGGLPYQDSCA